MKLLFTAVATIGLTAIGVMAATTNGLLKAEIQGRNLAWQLCEGQPTAATNTGFLQIRNAQVDYLQVPVKCEITVAANHWESLYEAGATNRNTALLVVHAEGRPNEYFYRTNSAKVVPVSRNVSVLERWFQSPPLSGAQLMTPFADSDFWICDLGLQFFHWPEQAIVKREFRRGCGCMVLQSTNPQPSPHGYSRVLTWIDEKSLGIVQAKAYDANGKLLKEFYPKEIKKVKGQWQVESMEIRNVQTGSRTWIKFDLNSK